MGLFNSLGIGYSGLSASQTAINVTSNNISNANTEGYSKQRVSQKVKAPIHQIPGDVGNGTRIESITRAHDEFIYSRLKGSSANLAYSEKMEKGLKEIASYSLDLEDLGIAKDIKDFFSSWSSVAQNPNDNAPKVVLHQSMSSLVQNLNRVSGELFDMQDRLNSEFKSGIDRVNKIASEIVELNKGINRVENSNSANANDLRDRRDTLELELAKMVNIEVSKGRESSDYFQKANLTDQGSDYNINIGGFNIVDGVTFHPIRAEDGVNSTRLNSAYYIDQNQKQVDITSEIRGGTLGAILDLRGDRVDSTTSSAKNSKIQEYIDDLDSFSKTLKEAVNSIYASSAQDRLISDSFNDFSSSLKLINLDGISSGSFDIKVYDSSGSLVGVKSIVIDQNTTLHKNSDGTINPNSIVSQINQNSDDNQDNDGTNDIDDLFLASMVGDKLSVTPKVDGYTIAVEDNGTNFAGIAGFNKLFTGSGAKDISIASEIESNPSAILANKAPIDGNSDLANEMLSLQFKELSFKRGDQKELYTLDGFYRYSSSKIASDTNQASINRDAADALNKTVINEFKSVSGVDMDEELVNLMKYQAAYQANAKIITTVDRMIDTLLGIKQ